MRVMKFGGTSIDGSAGIGRSAQLIASAAMSEPVVAVVSAFRGVTDALLKIAQSAASGNQWEEQWHSIQMRHISAARELGTTAIEPISLLCQELYQYCTGIALLGECTPRLLDEVAAFGELLSSTLLYHYLRKLGYQCEWYDARKLIKTDTHFGAAAVDWESTSAAVDQHLVPLLDKHSIIVTQGFIGSTRGGITTTLGRGGSDYSAAILGACLQARCVEIWTDVPGVMSADPRLIPEAVTLPEVTLDEITVLAAYGAKVLHPATVQPAIEHRVPVCVRNTFDPSAPGTVLSTNLSQPTIGIRAMSLLPSCTILEHKPYLQEPHQELLTCNMLGSTYRVVMEDTNHGIPCALLCAVGANIHKHGYALQSIGAVAEQLSSTVQVLASSPVSLLIALERQAAHDFLRALHGHMYATNPELVL